MIVVAKSKRPSRKKICSIDLDIVRILAIDRFATRRDIVRRLEEKPDIRRIQRRLRYLQKIGLIEPLVGDGDSRLGYRLSGYGKYIAARQNLAPMTVLQSRPAFKSQFDHDQIVNEVRDILIPSAIVSGFVSEAELRSQSGGTIGGSTGSDSHEWKVPDAMFTLRTRGGEVTVALEVELSQKAKARYSKIVQALLTSRRFQFVFVVCRNTKLQELMVHAISSARESNALVRASNRSNGIYFCQLDALRLNRLDAPWRGETKTFTINELTNDQLQNR
jgi:hypothetical protein